MIIPDTQVHMDGHPVLTYTYSVYRDKQDKALQQAEAKQSRLHLEQNNDPDYMGYITFELPGKLFNYTPDGSERLNSDELEETIEMISEYRDKSSLWKI